ncbi:MAG: hypothetical protein A3F73_06380 [Gallionellales bacterium RIFCSPLOWO2_12_FULL_59_22]|nr:MAG: hypothetical protein A3H99_11265 [Gallionellales bacterium RIFCSPLOWO2_02_FULL_59_110]OGT03065.1 MAG: hypothetical protein A2Z65_02710 [Gallionellales bacterium RIFCSPLOWO2_02_58_13]OGT13482.1 MAG: hypothetical protein A3F73_06380 [Gallionellales bacterium RIFCSPLOWO2_12_FULL_59_22]
MLNSANAFAGLNKWVDADGKVHYSDQQPPPNVQTQTLRIPSEAAAPASAPDAPKTVAEREAELKKAQQSKKEEAGKAAQEQARAEEEKAYCATLQQNLRALQDGVRVVEIDAKGERSYLEDEQRRQRIEKAQQEIKAHCK